MDFLAITIIAMLMVPVHFLCRWVFRRIQPRKRQLLFIWTSTIIITPLIYVALGLVTIAVITHYPRREFDKARWAADAGKRYEMTHDLVDNKKLIGKTKQEVGALLGWEENLPERDHWSYYVGFRPGLMNIDPDVLEIEFKDGVVVACVAHGT